MVTRFYSNVTLTSLNGHLSLLVYLPNGVEIDDEDLGLFYYSSRFEHGSMIGSITRKSKSGRTHTLYGTDMWRIPHNSNWPESGVGLASEFGVGDDGDICYFRCGWSEAADVTNGVLGYQDVQAGEAFLKIGVGQLIKGTCPACDSTDDYRFNSPYFFARAPRWKMTKLTKNSHNQNTALSLETEETLRGHGYKLRKDISLDDNVLTVTTTLQNLGRESFSTVWYSHHLFTCDSIAVGPGYGVDLDLNGLSLKPVYQEPSTWNWATPLAKFGMIKPTEDTVHVGMNRALDPGTRIKAEFLNDHATTGGFTFEACETHIQTSVESPFLQSGNDHDLLSMYAFNLYVERGTFSPEPQYLIRDLQPGQEVFWTMKLVIDDADQSSSIATEALSSMIGLPSALIAPHWVIGASLAMLIVVLLRRARTYERRRQYDDL